jgi:hypothetical protein
MNLGGVLRLWLALLAGEYVRAEDFGFFFDAVSAGDAWLVGAYLASGVDPNCSDEDGLTPLILAAKHGHLEVIGRSRARDWGSYALLRNAIVAGVMLMLRARRRALCEGRSCHARS